MQIRSTPVAHANTKPCIVPARPQLPHTCTTLAKRQQRVSRRFVVRAAAEEKVVEPQGMYEHRALVARLYTGSVHHTQCMYCTLQLFTAAAAPANVSGVAVPEDDVDWVAVLAPEDLPKGVAVVPFGHTNKLCDVRVRTSMHSTSGVRKEVRVGGRTLLLFWYRNQIYCTEARSPAEGAYSEGLIKGKFTQDFAIECPTTGTLYSLKDGSIVEW